MDDGVPVHDINSNFLALESKIRGKCLTVFALTFIYFVFRGLKR